MALSINKALPNLSKLEPPDGANYKCWFQKLLIFFEQLEVGYMLFSDLSEENNASEIFASSPDGTIKSKSKIADEATLKKFEKENKTVRGHLLNHMTNLLFNLFVIFKSAKIIWGKVEAKYGHDDVGKKKYLVGEWLHFQIIDDKPIMEQVYVYENLCTEVLSENIRMCEILQVNVLIEKFPPS